MNELKIYSETPVNVYKNDELITNVDAFKLTSIKIEENEFYVRYEDKDDPKSSMSDKILFDKNFQDTVWQYLMLPIAKILTIKGEEDNYICVDNYGNEIYSSPHWIEINTDGCIINHNRSVFISRTGVVIKDLKNVCVFSRKRNQIFYLIRKYIYKQIDSTYIIDENGNTYSAFPFIYWEKIDEGLFCIEDKEGKHLIDCELKKVTHIIGHFNRGWAYKFGVLSNNSYPLEAYAIINKNGIEISLHEYQSFYFDGFEKANQANYFQEGRLLVLSSKGRGWGFLNEKGEECIKCKYHYAESFQNGVAKVRYNTEFGYINLNGELKINHNGSCMWLPNKYGWGWVIKDNFIKVQIDDKFGIINLDKEEIVSCIYDDIIQFDNVFLVKRKGLTGIINYSGNFVLEYNGVQVVAKNKYDWVYPFCEDYAIVEIDGQYGYIDLMGNEIVLYPIGTKVWNFSCQLAKVQYNNICYYVNSRGNIVITGIKKEAYWHHYSSDYFYREERVTVFFDDAGSFKNNLAWIKKDDKYGFINKWGNLIVPFIYDYADDFDKQFSSLAKVGIKQPDNNTLKYGFIDKSGEIVIPIEYDDITKGNEHNRLLPYFESNSKNLQIYKKDNLYGIINRKGDIIALSNYEEIVIFEDDIFILRDDKGFSTLIDTNLKEIVPWGEQNIERIDNYFIIGNSYCRTYNYYQQLINIKGEVLIKKDRWSIQKKANNKFLCKNWNTMKTYLFDLEKQEMVEWKEQKEQDKYYRKGEYKEKMAFVQSKEVRTHSILGHEFIVGGKYGFINEKGEEIVPCIYDTVLDFQEGLAAVKKDRFWGFIDKAGKEVIPLQYLRARSFSEGLAFVVDKGVKDLFINKQEEVVIDVRKEFNDYFDEVSDFKNGKATITRIQRIPRKDEVEYNYPLYKGARTIQDSSDPFAL